MILTNQPTLLIDSRCTLGESPRWHPAERALYWVDIAEHQLHRWHAATEQIDTRMFDQPVACLAFRNSGGLLLGMKDGCAIIDDWDADPVPVGDQVLAGKPDHRMNDGRTDPMGRFWVGSVNSAKDVADATLYRLDSAAQLVVIESGMMTCNGAAFDQKGEVFHHTDTPSHALRRYAVDPATGDLSDKKLFHQFDAITDGGVGPGLGRPDGGSFDLDGCYWAALFDGWRVVRLSPAGELLREVRLPVQRPTMIAFGGDDGCTAFVTTARAGLSEAGLAAQPGAGGIFAFRVDVAGVPEWPAAV